MNTIGAKAAIWTILLAIPFTALALAATAYITEHLIAIATAITTWTGVVLHLQRDLMFEAELIGLVAGQVIILAILGFTVLSMRNHSQSEK